MALAPLRFNSILALSRLTSCKVFSQAKWRSTEHGHMSEEPLKTLEQLSGKVEQDYLSMTPAEIEKRKTLLEGLGIFGGAKYIDIVMQHSPAGFFLQDWTEFLKKFYYIEHNVIDWLYDKKELQILSKHPLIANAAVMERSFDHIRARSMFAQRSGYKSLTSLRKVGTASNMIGLGDIILSDVDTYLRTVAPHCTREEYDCFVNLITNYDLEDNDADLYDELSQVMSMKKINSKR